MEDTSKFNWDKEVVFQGETLCADQLDRAKYAEFLTNYLNSAGQRDNGYVINLNAEWGAGKTWFLKRWYKELEENHPVAYIDAWKNDFSDTPMLTVVSGILSSLEADPNTKVLKNRHRFAESFKTISKRALPTLATGLAKQYLGVDLNDDGKTDSDAAEGLGRMFEKALEAHDQTLKGVEQYRTEITRWLEEATAEKGTSGWKSPMYVFIDELDRCRPTYAIELLETVKHLFEIKGIVFVIATNTDQLQHSIKAVYGAGFDANRYLLRFFARTLSLPNPDRDRYIEMTADFPSLWQSLQSTLKGNCAFSSSADLASALSYIALIFEMSLRDMDQWISQLQACLASEHNKERYFWLIVALMLAFKLKSSEFFQGWWKEGKTIHIDQIRSVGLRPSEKRDIRMNLKCRHYMRTSVEVDLLDLMNRSNDWFTQDITSLQRASERSLSAKGGDKGVMLIQLIISDLREEKMADYQGYTNLVSMASDLR